MDYLWLAETLPQGLQSFFGRAFPVGLSASNPDNASTLLGATVG